MAHHVKHMQRATATAPRRTRVAVVGAGFSGVAMALAMQRAGHLDDVTLIDAADDVGGTWRDNRYPGCACDVPSHLYSLEGEPHDWPALYSSQPAIHEYVRAVVDRHGLRARTRLGVAVERQVWDESTATWTLHLADGSSVEAEVVVNALGALRRQLLPRVPGLGTFAGSAFHTADWDPHVQITGRRVGVIGTGASAVQVVPSIAGQAAHLHVFQRTPSWVLPRVERTFSRAERWALRHVPGAQQAVRTGVYLIVEHLVWRVLAMDPAAQDRARRLGLYNIRRGIADPGLRAAVTPDLAPGCKRLMFSNTYYPALARPDVTLETTAIAEITPAGVRLADGRQVELDVLVYGTGFDPHHFWYPMDVRGVGGVALDAHWATAGTALNGTTTPGFPNMFFLLGPNTGTGHNSVLLVAEAQAAYVAQALEYLRSGAADWLAPTPQATEAYGREVADRHADLVWATGCGSWYLNDAGINDTIYPGPVREFQRRVARFDVEHYQLGRIGDAAARPPAAAEPVPMLG
jgi:cation diffusion facilitator CzcD-associated flavoprotein CzcO